MCHLIFSHSISGDVVLSSQLYREETEAQETEGNDSAGLIQEGRGWTRSDAEVLRVIAARGSDHVDTVGLVQV